MAHTTTAGPISSSAARAERWLHASDSGTVRPATTAPETGVEQVARSGPVVDEQGDVHDVGARLLEDVRQAVLAHPCAHAPGATEVHHGDDRSVRAAHGSLANVRICPFTPNQSTTARRTLATTVADAAPIMPNAGMATRLRATFSTAAAEQVPAVGPVVAERQVEVVQRR